MQSKIDYRKGPRYPFVSVVIPVYNDAERLSRCLQALDSQTYPGEAYEVIVVDNASTESIDPVVAAFEQSRTVYEAKRGSYAARNCGVGHARGEVIAFTDSDCVPQSTWIEQGVRRLTRNPSCGLVGGHIDFFFRVPGSPSPPELYDSGRWLKQKAYVEKDNFAATANAFTRRRVFEEVGLFNSDLYSGGDAEWGQRVAQAGYDVCYAPNACVQHPARRTYRALRQKKLRLVEGDIRSKKRYEYSFQELFFDVVKDLGHHIKFAVGTTLANRQYGLKERARLLFYFPLQGMCTASKRTWVWLRRRKIHL
jgi:glycosyltransferase involved in cell wall biosynthesis